MVHANKTVLDRREFLGMLPVAGFVWAPACDSVSAGEEPLGRIIENNDERITIDAEQYRASVVKKGYVSGVAEGSFYDKKTGARDRGFGLCILDYLLAPGPGKPEDPEPYRVGIPSHGEIVKHWVERPQICTMAKQLTPVLITGRNFMALKLSFKWYLAEPGRTPGSHWEQWLVFPHDKRFFFVYDRVTLVDGGEGIVWRGDYPGHLFWTVNDRPTFDEIYLSYAGVLPRKEFDEDFPPERKFRYLRGAVRVPRRMIRAQHLLLEDGRRGPWLAGLTLRPEVVYDAWCHRRSYVCFIMEIGGYSYKNGQSFGAVNLTGYFDSLPEMEETFDRYAGADSLVVKKNDFCLLDAQGKQIS